MLLDNIKSEIIVPAIALLFTLALIYFLWGVVQYVLNLNNPAGRQTGQMHMFWGVIGLGIMLSAFGIVNFVFNSVNDPDDATVYGIDGKPIEKPDILKPNGQTFVPVTPGSESDD
jgi:hypothetical protein